MSLDLIAEIGSNHCGSLELAIRHIKSAQQAFATGVKFQLFRAETLDARPEVQDKLRRFELPPAWLPHLAKAAHSHGLTFGVTPFAVDLVEPLRGIVDWVKISAYDLEYEDLVRAAMRLGVPVVLSTAMATAGEIDQALQKRVIRYDGDSNLVYLHEAPILLYGVASYPALFEQHDFARLDSIAARGGRCGLSDHTTDDLAACVAVARGATWIEKHFRETSRDCPLVKTSPDYDVSVTPPLFKLMAQRCRAIYTQLHTFFPPGPQGCEEPLLFAKRTNAKPLRGEN